MSMIVPLRELCKIGRKFGDGPADVAEYAEKNIILGSICRSLYLAFLNAEKMM
jgi:hypothetical protein